MKRVLLIAALFLGFALISTLVSAPKSQAQGVPFKFYLQEQALPAGEHTVAEEPTFTLIDFPGADSTQAWGINPRGDIVGYYNSAGVTHGFLLSEGNFTTIDFPGAASTSPFAINPRGDIVGNYVSAGVTHSFLLSGGNFTSFDFPNAKSSE